MSDEPKQDNVARYSVTFSLDRSNFLRRACPSCGRHFKTKADPSDLAAILQPAFRKAEMEIGEALSVEGITNYDGSNSILHCPYCRYSGEAGDMLTPELGEYLKRYVMREVIFPKVNRMLSGFADSFGHHRTPPRGFISFEMRVEHDDPNLPLRPISGPEPPDMIAVSLLCCGKQAKISDKWRDLIVCPYCGATVALQ